MKKDKDKTAAVPREHELAARAYAGGSTCGVTRVMR